MVVLFYAQACGRGGRKTGGIDAHRWRLEALSSDGRGRKWVGVNIDIHRDVDRWACKVLGVARGSPLPPLVHFIIIIETAPSGIGLHEGGTRQNGENKIPRNVRREENNKTI